jgi:hypothetical protein
VVNMANRVTNIFSLKSTPKYDGMYEDGLVMLRHSPEHKITPYFHRIADMLISKQITLLFLRICLIKPNKMHFAFLIYSNDLSSTCFEEVNCSSSGGSYCICGIWYLPCRKY